MVTERLHVRVGEVDKRRWSACAEAAGMDLGAWVRSACMAAEERSVERESVAERVLADDADAGPQEDF